MHKGFYAVFILFTLCVNALAQTIVTGHVYDLGTQADISGVTIEWKNEQKSTYSNTYGDFSIKSKTSETDQSKGYHFISNTLVWEETENFELAIISLSGREIYKETVLGNTGSQILPRLKYGLYLLSIKTSSHIASYKLLSDGFKTIAVDKNASAFRNPKAEQNDTLLFSQDGYYSREVILKNSNAPLDIGLLKGNYENLNYFNELIDPIAFDLVSSSPSRSNLGEVRSVKILYDLQNDLLYYINDEKYNLHYTFAADILQFNQGLFVFNQTQYRNNPNRYMYLGSINYYQSQEKYVLQFSPLTELNCQEIKVLYDKILSTSYIDDDLYFYSIKPEWDTCNGIQKISSEELFQGQNYQALNLTNGYGYLRKVPIEELPDTYLGRQDIVLVDGIPNDLSVVAGIITTAFQTPLSHINVLSNSRDTPNMALKDGWSNPKLNQLLNELVYLNVTSDTFEIRKATLDEANAFWELKTPRQPIVLEKNVQFSDLIEMTDANLSYLNRIGGKAANFSEIIKVNVQGEPIPVPEGAFAIPFYYYQKHLEENGLDEVINSMLINQQFITDPVHRKERLDYLRTQIIEAPLSSTLLNEIKSKIDDFQDFDAYRFRSSTNAEDLETFSGAGLYDSYSAKKNHDKKTIDRAIKKVWASLWNWRAFEERSYFKIDHKSCAMGILVHRSFPDEDANGVLVTKNLYNFNPGFIINVQIGENSIVFPEPGIIHDQIILYEWPVNSTSPFLIEYLTFSNIPEANGGRVMSDAELTELGNYSMALKRHFYYNLPHDCNCSFKDFGLDIEFKVDSQVSPRKVYVKQARLYR